VLSLDPLAALAGHDEDVHAELARLTPSDERALAELWQAAQASPTPVPAEVPPLREQFLVLIQCTDEHMQTELLERFQAEGLPCRALMS